MEAGSEHTTEAIAKLAQYGGTGGTVAGTVWAWLGSNAVPLGLSFAFISMICTIIGTRWIIRHKRLQMRLLEVNLEIANRELNKK